ncbi:MAG: membrane protein insertase YidC [Thermodesulfovibrionia bacterium]|nr:MAG: membrane protein insertase YidC [Thermodesulfovibrionia bacterium]
MDKRTLIAIGLSLLVLVAFSLLTPISQKPVQKQAEPRQEDRKAETVEDKKKMPTGDGAPAAATEIPVEGKEIQIETDLYSAVLATRGATITKWDLKEYSDKEGNPVSLVPPDMTIPSVSILFEGELKDLPAKATYSVNKDSIIFDRNKKSDSLTFFYSDPSGLSIRKTFTFYKDNYKVDLITEVNGVPSYKVVLGSEFGIFNEQESWVHIGPVLLKENKKIDIDRNNIDGAGFIKRRILGEKSKSEVEYKGDILWIAQEDKYFTSALVSVNRDNDAVIWAWEKGGGNITRGAEIAYKVTGKKGEFLLYAGPKKYDILKTLGIGLEHIIDFGFFSIISKPLFWVLTLFYNIIGNYGWAIILLTIVVRIPFIPLVRKGHKSMKKLQTVQPHMAAIKEKYKKDPQKLQKETMELYKKHKVNPMGGCLPMLIQLPVFFALYKILLIAIELRGAPFILWITDLSEKDPYYIFPIVMGLTMVIQQKMTPSGMDPRQAKMMMLMPIFFTFLFLSFPSGLVIYWLTSNLLGITQQYFDNKKTKHSAS